MDRAVQPPPAYQRPLPSPSIVISTIGVQTREPAGLAPALALLVERFQCGSGPAVVERARFSDGAGWENEVFVAYWLRRDDFDRWFSGLQDWWDASEREIADVGLWREVVQVPTSRFENIFSSPSFSVGTGRLVSASVGPIQAHGYWGSMRERLAIAATDHSGVPGRALRQRCSAAILMRAERQSGALPHSWC